MTDPGDDAGYMPMPFDVPEGSSVTMEGTARAFKCAVCDQPSTTGPLDPEAAAAFDAALDASRDIVCDGCVAAIAVGVCGDERQGYACLRPDTHLDDDKWHASRSGDYMVTWSATSRGVKLRRWPEGAVL